MSWEKYDLVNITLTRVIRLYNSIYIPVDSCGGPLLD